MKSHDPMWRRLADSSSFNTSFLYVFAWSPHSYALEMLVLHHDSSCDICLDSYSATKTPFAVACGHIFCSE